MPTVYLLHFDRPIHHAKHYLGYTCLDSVDRRINRHRNGSGAKFLRVANHLGIQYSVVRTWECSNHVEAKHLERRLKSWHNSPKLCPVCNENAHNLAK